MGRGGSQCGWLERFREDLSAWHLRLELIVVQVQHPSVVELAEFGMGRMACGRCLRDLGMAGRPIYGSQGGRLRIVIVICNEVVSV